MDAIYIVGATPVFFLLIGIEYWITVRQRKEYFHFADTINSLSCGVFQQAVNILFTFWLIRIYEIIYENYRLFTVSMNSAMGWIACIFAVDFAYYLFHRASHRVNFIWAAHVVHHQSEEYNLSTALRQSALQGAFSVVFDWPLAILGFPPAMTLLSVTIVILYQFWIHTRLIYKLSWFESVFNTPSHHRVHHGIDPECIDKNYAGLFIIWDKFFGTFIPESTRAIHYGTVDPLSSWNPLWANIEGWIKIGKLSWASKNWKDKLYAWIAPPEWRPKELGGMLQIPEVDERHRILYRTYGNFRSRLYILLQFMIVLGVTVFLLLLPQDTPKIQLIVLNIWIAISLLSLGGVIEKKSWAVALEVIRFLGLVPLVFLFLP